MLSDYSKRTLRTVMCAEGQKNYPNESCGVVIKKGKKQSVIALPNRSREPESQFLISDEDLRNAAGDAEVIAVWHTHINIPETPSEADIAACEASAVPWFILSVRREEDGAFSFSDVLALTPEQNTIDLLERPYVFGSFDCWTLAIDYYRTTHGLKLGEYPRIHDFWKQEGGNFFGSRANWEAEGFFPVSESELAEGDLILFCTDHTGNPNHCAVYVGDGLILHHVEGRLSARDVYYGYWQRNALHFLRNKNVC